MNALDVVERAYSRVPHDATFHDVLSRADDVTSDHDLAELIDADGRKRLIAGLPVSLDRYIKAVPDIADRPDVLDAAIDIALRAVCGSSHPDAGTVEQLTRAYPQFAQAIHEAAAISNALWSTNGLQEMFASRPELDTPCEFGPTLADNRRRYDIRHLLGTGAAGQVYLAVDRQMSDDEHDALVALKIVTAGDQSDIARLRRSDEATRARRIDHPNVVRVLDRGITGDGTEYIVYEYVDGGDLAEWLNRRSLPLPPREAAALVAQIARGVQAAHNAGLVHCDLKPGNIMRSAGGELKIADFGVARSLNAAARASQEAADEPIGNLAFISPEQYRMDDGAHTPPSDVYALGGILFHLLTGVLPNGSSVAEIARTHDRATGRTAPPRFPDALRVDPDLRAICHQAMAFHAADRYNAAGMLADDLDRWLRREPVSVHPPSVIRRAYLWSCRKPAHAVTVALLSISLVFGAVVGAWALATAVEQDRQTQLAAELGSRLHAAKDRPAPSSMFMESYVTRLLSGPQMLNMEAADLTAWRAMLDTLIATVHREEAAGRGDHIMTLLTKLVVAMWLTSDGEPARAQTLIDELQHQLPAIVEADDALLDLLAFAERCNAVSLLATDAAARDLTPAERAHLVQVRTGILTYARRLNETDLASAPHLLAWETLRAMHTEALLDDADMVEVADAHLAALRNYNPIFPEPFQEQYRLAQEKLAAIMPGE